MSKITPKIKPEMSPVMLFFVELKYITIGKRKFGTVLAIPKSIEKKY